MLVRGAWCGLVRDRVSKSEGVVWVSVDWCVLVRDRTSKSKGVVWNSRAWWV